MKFSPPLPKVLPPDSCLRMSVKENIACFPNCNIPDLAVQKLINPIPNPDGSISYQLKITQKAFLLSVSAVLNLGWCKTGSEWIRNGDYLSDTAHELEVKKGKNNYVLNVAAKKYSISPVQPRNDKGI